jgi:hypothetical protein
VAHTYNPNYLESRIRRIPVQSQPGKKFLRPIKAGCSGTRLPSQLHGVVAQVVQHLPSKSEALISNPGLAKIKKELGLLVYTCNLSTWEAKTMSQDPVSNKTKEKRKKKVQNRELSKINKTNKEAGGRVYLIPSDSF